MKTKPIDAAVSKIGKLEEVSILYEQIQELFRIGRAEHRTELLYYELFKDFHNEKSLLVDYKQFQEINDYQKI